jgi:hypothetical protein
MSNLHQEVQQVKDESTLPQLKAEHDQQPNLIQQLEIGRQGLNMNLDKLAGHKNSEYAPLPDRYQTVYY